MSKAGLISSTGLITFLAVCAQPAFAESPSEVADGAANVTNSEQLGQAEPVAAVASPATSDEDAGQTGDIIVTAQRRAENIQDVPVAVAYVEGEQLAAIGVESVVDVKIAVPSLATQSTAGLFGAAIRGIGSFGFSPGIESEVALYVDGVYIAAPIASELALNNVASLEVLKGPQGTLFGRNSTGGLIQITTAKPTYEPSGNFSVQYGSYDNVIGTAYLSGGLAEKLAADIAVRAERRDGFGTNLTTGNETNAIKHDVVVRSKMVWEPGSDTTVTAIGNYWDGKNTGRNAIIAGTLNAFNGTISPDLGSNDSVGNREESLDGWSAGGSLKIDHQFGDVDFMSQSAYRKSSFDTTRDLDATAAQIASLAITQLDKHFSQELQLSSANSSRLKWTAGLYYFDYTTGYLPANIDLTAVVIENLRSKQRSKSYSGYAQATYEIFDRTNLTLGGRYTSEARKELDASQTVKIRTPVGQLVIPQVFPDRKITDKRFTYRVSLDHRFNDQVLAYASLNTGFKSGGFNTGAPGSPSFKPEDLTAYEAGIKTDLFDRKLRLNLAAFHYKYQDIQVTIIDPNNPSALIVINGAKAKVDGLDADFEAVLTDEFSLTGGFALLDTKFTSFPAPTCPIYDRGGR